MSHQPNLILDGNNATLTVTNLAAAPSGASTLNGVPIGTVGATATGEIAVKAKIVGGPFYATALAITFATPLSTNASTGSMFYFTATSNFTLANPTGAYNGQRITWRISQDGTGGRIITLGTKFNLGDDVTAVVLSTGAGAYDYLTVIYNAQTDTFDVFPLLTGF